MVKVKNLSFVSLLQASLMFYRLVVVELIIDFSVGKFAVTSLILRSIPDSNRGHLIDSEAW